MTKSSAMFFVLTGAVLAGCTEGPPRITIELANPDLAAIDRGDGWELLPSETRVALDVEGPFALASVCAVDDIVAVEVELATAADRDEWRIDCWSYFLDSNHELEIRLDASAPAGARTDVALGHWRSTVDADAPRTARLPTGRTDRLAIEEDGDRFVLDRDVAIDGPAEWVIRMEQEGRRLDDHPIAIPDDLAGAELTVRTEITMNRIETDIRDDDENPATAYVLPANVLRASDTQRVRVLHTIDESQARWIARTPGDGPLDVQLPAPLDSAELAHAGGLPTATWEDDRAWPRRQLVGWQSIGGGGQSWTVTAHPGWNADAGEDGAIRFPDVTTIEGWLTWWNLAGDFTARLYLSSDPDADDVVGVDRFGAVSWP